MSYVVFCTFDLKNAGSTDYQNAYADLAKLGLQKVHKADQGNQIVIPTTSVMGSFNGANAGTIGDDIRQRVRAAFNARGFTSEIFVVVGGENWAWRSGTT